MMIWGGQNSSGLLDDGALFDPAENQWAPLTLPGAPVARTKAAAVWVDEWLFVWGGEGFSGRLNDGARLLFSRDAPAEWRALGSTGGPSVRSGHSAVWTGKKVIVWGGQNGGVFLSDGAAYDPGSDSWETLPSVGAPVARSGHGAVWTGEEMVVFAGQTASGPTGSGAAYDPNSRRWRPLSSAGNPLPRIGGTTVWTGTELLVFGGQVNGQSVASLQRLNPQPTWYFYRKP